MIALVVFFFLLSFNLMSFFSLGGPPAGPVLGARLGSPSVRRSANATLNLGGLAAWRRHWLTKRNDMFASEVPILLGNTAALLTFWL